MWIDLEEAREARRLIEWSMERGTQTRWGAGGLYAPGIASGMARVRHIVMATEAVGCTCGSAASWPLSTGICTPPMLSKGKGELHMNNKSTAVSVGSSRACLLCLACAPSWSSWAEGGLA
jgi:hypothetical protein